MKLQNVKKLCFLILGIFALLMLAMGFTSEPAFGYGAIGIVVIYGAVHMALWRCPKCGKNLGPLWVKHCPECGERISSSFGLRS